jgi:hypothetical protein
MLGRTGGGIMLLTAIVLLLTVGVLGAVEFVRRVALCRVFERSLLRTATAERPITPIP